MHLGRNVTTTPLIAGVLAVLVTLATVAAVLSTPTTARAQSVTGDAASLVQAILAAQDDSGAIATNADRQLLLPYLANYAAIGLADAEEADAAWSWLEWYAAAMDADGYVQDHVPGPLGWSGTGTWDSTDAYAGTFLMAALATWDADSDLERLQGLQPALRLAVAAIFSTLDDDGLTFATPEWRAKYLMDQAETYAGLKAAVALAIPLGDTDLALRSWWMSQAIRQGVAELWNDTTSSFDWAVHGDGVHTATKWTRFYPDAASQMWVVAFGLVDDETADALVDTFLHHHPGWASQVDDGYWPVVGWALQATGHPAAGGGLRRIATDGAARQHAWPFTTATAGQLLASGVFPVTSQQ